MVVVTCLLLIYVCFFLIYNLHKVHRKKLTDMLGRMDGRTNKRMVVCDGCVRGDLKSKGAHIMGTMGEITTFGLRTECMLSNSGLNTLLQDLRGKSRLI